MKTLINCLDKTHSRINVDPQHIHVLQTPADFYSTLLHDIATAQRRIFLSTLYIGRSETRLIHAIANALRQNPRLQVSILTDALRGTRESPLPSCASLTLPLIEEFPDRARVFMYHTPNLTGVRRRIVPKRINEGWGLQHMKIYGVDDRVILSGANLSRDYFTNRQDRYHQFRSPIIAEHFSRVHSVACSVSFALQSDGRLTWNTSCPNPLESPQAYLAAASEKFRAVSPPESSPPSSTVLYPTLGFPPTINTELPLLQSLISMKPTCVIFTAGYFNPHPEITRLLSKHTTVITASPQANGFFESKGISGMLPAAYTHLLSRFLRQAADAPIRVLEWQRQDWTYHAKGWWASFSREQEVQATLIGSSNYTTRSYQLDLEVGALIVTEDESLQRQWQQEKSLLEAHTQPVSLADLETPDRRANWRVRLAMWIVKRVGGAL